MVSNRKRVVGCCFACDKFHFFVYGREVTVHSDHKPLESIMKKDIDSVTVRLQAMLITLLRYPKINVKFRPGKEILVADCLSRAPLRSEEDYSEKMKMAVHRVREEVCMSEQNRRDYQAALQHDDSLRRIMEYVEKSSWPGYYKLHVDDQHWSKVKDELHVEEGMLFKDHKLVIPKSLRMMVGKWIHMGHMGRDKTVDKGKSMYYWPGMVTDLEIEVQSCGVCEKYQRMQQKENLHLEERPLFPFHRVGMDIFEHGGKDYLAIYDAFSGLLIAEKLSDKSAAQITKVLEECFIPLGYPAVLKADNNPFSARLVQDYCESKNMKIIFSSPRYPQSNGLAEKGVSIAKNIIKKSPKNWKELEIQEYNITRVKGKGASPSELFFGRQIKTGKHPIQKNQLKRKWIPENEVTEKIESNRTRP